MSTASPESHAASFALLVYDSAWLKHYEPAAFTCALLNSQPMGFYAPAQLVRDARQHGVEVRPVCVAHSDWDCTLEPATDESGAQPALRLGAAPGAWARAAGGAAGDGCAQRASVQERRGSGAARRPRTPAIWKRSPSAGALASLSGNRHLAFWEVAGFEKALPLAAGIRRARR